MHSPVSHHCREHLLAGQTISTCAHTIAASHILKPKQELSVQQRMMMLCHVTVQRAFVCFVLCCQIVAHAAAEAEAGRVQQK